jgi:hypothetical protein
MRRKEILRCVLGYFVSGKRLNFSYYEKETGCRNAISKDELFTVT